MDVVVKQITGRVVGIAVHAIVVGSAVPGEVGRETIGAAGRPVLLPAISETVVNVTVGRRSVRRAATVGDQIRANEAIELVIGIVPVAVYTVVRGGHVSVRSQRETKRVDGRQTEGRGVGIYL